MVLSDFVLGLSRFNLGCRANLVFLWVEHVMNRSAAVQIYKPCIAEQLIFFRELWWTTNILPILAFGRYQGNIVHSKILESAKNTFTAYRKKYMSCKDNSSKLVVSIALYWQCLGLSQWTSQVNENLECVFLLSITSFPQYYKIIWRSLGDCFYYAWWLF